MDELVQQGMVRIAERKKQIVTLKSELAALAQNNARRRTVNNAELMGSAWHRLQNALYMLRLLEREMFKLRKRQLASAQALPRPYSPCPNHSR